MESHRILLLGAIVSCMANAAPVPILNFSGEVNNDPEYPQTGGQFADWPQTVRQTDNDGRVPTGFLPVIDTPLAHESGRARFQ